MRSLHVACLPFPSPQGTQGLITAMCKALSDAGDDVHLLVYESGESGDWPFTVHRAKRARSGFRSGPSVAKVIADARMVHALRALTQRTRFDVVFAHNVEASMVCSAARLSMRWVYVAHTRMDTELPTYLRGGLGGMLAGVVGNVGAIVDALACRAPAIAAVSPALAAHLGGSYLPAPWPVAAPVTPEERADARREHGLSGTVAIYAGNLDGYQGWEAIVAAHDAGMQLVVATDSDPRPLRALGVDRVLPLRTEADRRKVHALADVALVPRKAEGGLPIKLLDALSRGVPVATTHLALAGLRPRGVVVGDTLGDALQRFPNVQGGEAGEEGRRWLQEHAAPSRFVDSARTIAWDRS